MCADVLDSPAQITFTSAPDAQESLNWEVSIDRATAEIGYQPRFPLRDSILAVAEEAPWAQ
jgi:nucleoside-diphosphate-sugar epimerase